MRTWAKVTHRFEATHCWPGAKDQFASYLQHPHRHLFHVTVWVQVKHDDRDIEFMEFLNWLRSICPQGEHLGSKSCEMLAQGFIDATHEKWGHDRLVKCEVTEDGENGALVEELG